MLLGQLPDSITMPWQSLFVVILSQVALDVIARPYVVGLQRYLAFQKASQYESAVQETSQHVTVLELSSS